MTLSSWSHNDMNVVVHRLGTFLCCLSCCSGSLLVPYSMAHRQLAQATANLEEWPDSHSFTAKLVFETDGSRRRVRPPSFTDGHGPVGVFAMLYQNNEAQTLLEALDNSFAKFCLDVRNNILDSSEQRQVFDDTCILAAPQGSHHITVAIFQEHHSLLSDAEQKADWRSTDEIILEKLKLDLSKAYVAQNPAPQSSFPQLTLNALLLTADGALIACFEDSTENFLRLRSVSNEVAMNTYGALTSRPKTLIHATIGRVIGLPEGATSDQRARLTALAKQYNVEELPRLVTLLQQRGQASFSVRDLSLLRNTIWLMYDRTVYTTWNLE